jgi:hypothetical protein
LFAVVVGVEEEEEEEVVVVRCWRESEMQT